MSLLDKPNERVLSPQLSAASSPKTDRQKAMLLQRQLATYANTMDSLVRIPFTRQGIGADAAVGVLPVVGDIAGLVLASYAIFRAKQIGVPLHKLAPAIRLAALDVGVGFVPLVGDMADVFIRPSRRAVMIVNDHLRDLHGIESTDHTDHPVLHRVLEQKQQQSAFWRNPVVAWFWLRIPDFLGVLVLLWLVFSVYWVVSWLIGLL
ncbi:MAG: DUF4112 domain-containing protein [Flavobacteriales bacterium]